MIESRKGKAFGGLSLKSADGRKEIVHQCFLFSGYLLLTTRSSSGRLHISKVAIHGICKVIDLEQVRGYVIYSPSAKPEGSARGCGIPPGWTK